jgi:hypothetical protein
MKLIDYVTPERIEEFKKADSGFIYVEDLLLDNGVYVEAGDRRIDSLLMLFDKAILEN